MRPVGSKGGQEIPGVGRSITANLQRLGIARVDQLRGRQPQDFYARMMEQQGGHIDCRMLYVLRCGVLRRRQPRAVQVAVVALEGYSTDLIMSSEFRGRKACPVYRDG